MTRQKLPAYGRHLEHAIATGKRPRHGVAVWIDRMPVRGICAPLAVFSDTDPGALDWSLCRGMDVIVPHADEVQRERLIAVCRAIKAAAPRRLLLLKQDPPGHEFVVSAEGAK